MVLKGYYIPKVYMSHKRITRLKHTKLVNYYYTYRKPNIPKTHYLFKEKYLYPRSIPTAAGTGICLTTVRKLFWSFVDFKSLPWLCYFCNIFACGVCW